MRGLIQRHSALAVYESGLLEGGGGGGGGCHAIGDDGSRRRLPLERWLRTPDAVEDRLLGRARGPVLDIGCGAGRHVVALRRRGVDAVGIEISRRAAALARERGGVVVEGSVFHHPLEAGWRTALLLDGNIGIGGDPATLLRRVASLLARDGAALVELEPPRSAPRASRVRLEHGPRVSEWIPWTFVGAERAAPLAAAAGLAVAELWPAGDRWFAELRKPPAEFPLGGAGEDKAGTQRGAGAA